jgi:hypothetical protein
MLGGETLQGRRTGRAVEGAGQRRKQLAVDA